MVGGCKKGHPWVSSVQALVKQETHPGTARGTVHTYPFKKEAEGDLTPHSGRMGREV